MANRVHVSQTSSRLGTRPGAPEEWVSPATHATPDFDIHYLAVNLQSRVGNICLVCIYYTLHYNIYTCKIIHVLFHVYLFLLLFSFSLCIHKFYMTVQYRLSLLDHFQIWWVNYLSMLEQISQLSFTIITSSPKTQLYRINWLITKYIYQYVHVLKQNTARYIPRVCVDNYCSVE